MINSQIGNNLHVSSLIIQMDWCDRGCNGCYIGGGEQTRKGIIWDFLDELIAENPRFSCNELILSNASGIEINAGNGDDPEITDLIEGWSGKRLVLGFKDIIDMLAFLIASGYETRHRILYKAEIAISDPNSIPFLHNIYRHFGLEPKIVYNRLQNKRLTPPGQQTYNIMMKPAKSQADLENSRFIARARAEFTEDRCVTVSLDKLPCSAGTQSFHIWPDGNVTGCPYRALDPDFKFPKPPENLDELINRIKRQQEHPDPLDYCPANPMNNYKGWNKCP